MIHHDGEAMKREIWFEKWLWSYMPCHWKGWVAMVAVIMPTVATILLVEYVANTLGYKNVDWLAILIFLIGWLSMLVIAKRHS